MLRGLPRNKKSVSYKCLLGFAPRFLTRKRIDARSLKSACLLVLKLIKIHQITRSFLALFCKIHRKSGAKYTKSLHYHRFEENFEFTQHHGCCSPHRVTI